MVHELKDQILSNGFAVLNDIFSEEEINRLSKAISKVDIARRTVRINAALFAIRQLLKEIPEAANIIFNVSSKH